MRAFLPIIFLLFSTLQLSAQQKDIVKNEGITSTLHRASIGKLVFTDKAIRPKELKEADILSTYRFTNKSNLFITFFMDNSLTNYLHRLAPGSTLDELYNNGNFQFAFYVDDKLVYRENLHHGAGLPATKDSQTVVNKPLIDNQHMGRWWSQSMWNRFLVRGGDSVLTDGKHLLKIEVATYINNPGLQTGPLLASGQLALEVKRKPKINIDTVQLNILKPYNGFPVSAESFDKTKIKELRGNINEAVFKNITSVVVIKNGKLLVEEYFNGAGRDSLHDTRSVGKSFASTLTGIALADGYLKSEDQTIKEFFDLKTFANYSPKKDAVTARELLTMSSAFSGDDDDVNSPGNEENMYPTPDWVKFTLDLPLDTVKPKGEWHYFTAGVMLLGNILHNNIPSGLENYTGKKLFKPLGITRYKWVYTPQKVISTAGGLEMKALDFAKYGQLYKNGGMWNGKQVIPKSWVDKTFTKQKAIPGRSNEYYGYLFWNKTYHISGKDYETYYCTGNGGNKIFVFKDVPLVIVITATAYGTAYAHKQVDKMMQEYILPAVVK